jgi:hypothetical protein
VSDRNGNRKKLPNSPADLAIVNKLEALGIVSTREFDGKSIRVNMKKVWRGVTVAISRNQPARPICLVPATSSIAEAQNTFGALRLLLEQCKTHSIAKIRAMPPGIRVGVVAIAEPIIAFVWPTSAVVIGAVAGVWIFLSRTELASPERHYSGKSAVVQERFDMTIFGMLPSPAGVPEVNPELISRTIGAGDVARRRSRSNVCPTVIHLISRWMERPPLLSLSEPLLSIRNAYSR